MAKINIIAIDIGGTNVKISVKTGKSESKILKFPTNEIFYNPDAVYSEIKNRLSDNFNLELKNVNKICITVPGEVKDGRIIDCYSLNKIADEKQYNGFSFIECFKYKIDKNYIKVLNDAEAACFGVISNYKNISYFPALVMTLGTGVGIGLINDNMRITLDESLGHKKIKSHEQGPTIIHDYLGNEGVKILKENNSLENFNKYYFKRIKKSIEKILGSAKKNYKNIFILGGNSLNISNKQIKEYNDKMMYKEYDPRKIILPPKTTRDAKIFLDGCFYYLEN